MQTFKMRLNRFFKSYTTMDLRTDEETRKVRCERFERKNKTVGKLSVFTISEG